MDLSRNAKLIVLIVVAIFGIVIIVAVISHHRAPNVKKGHQHQVKKKVQLILEPKIDPENNVITENTQNESESSILGNKLQTILEGYIPDEKFPPPAYCQYGGFSATINQSCKIDPTNLHESCTAANHNFGYGDQVAKPCIMIQMKTAKGWKPESYLSHDDLEVALQQGMPQRLHDQIEAILNISSSDLRLNTTWMLCDGVNPADIENIGPVEYYSPAFSNGQFPGFPNYYFPFENQTNYKVPFIFVRFPKIRKKVRIHVNCRIYVKNLDQNDGVQFEIEID